MLVYPDRMQVEVYEKDNQGAWHCCVWEGEAQVEISVLPDAVIELEMERIYLGLNLAEAH